MGLHLRLGGNRETTFDQIDYLGERDMARSDTHNITPGSSIALPWRIVVCSYDLG
jgi:hypothetical protein